MFGKCLNFAFLALVLSSCAEPKYEQKVVQNQGQTEQGQVADCSVRFNVSGNCLFWKWEKYPTESEPGTLVFKFYRLNTYDSSSVEIDAASVPEAVLWMPSMGHGSTPTAVTRLDVGTYRASNVFFIMPGEWEIKFQVKDGVTLKDEAVVSLTF